MTSSVRPVSLVERSSRSSFVPEIQALRAVAIALVLAYHLWPMKVPGGFIGVDIFFVVSGFLISSHLISSAQQGQLSLARFYARRIGRLLPAAFVVLGTTILATWTLAPVALRQDFFSGVAASTVYVQNWALAINAVDYLGSNDLATPVQHFWTLSVEEQFYLVWPILVLGTVVVARSAGRAARLSRYLGVLFTVIFLLSFVLSVVQTQQSPEIAYFATTTRAWEFAAGGMVSLVVGARVSLRWRYIVFGCSFAAVAYASFGLNGSSAFPGYLALIPVAATAFFILASYSGSAPVVQRLSRINAVQFVGGISYSLYLWHWPLIVFGPFVLGRSLTTWDKLCLVGIAIVLAMATKYLVEDPARRIAHSSVRLRRVFVVTAIATSLMLVVSGVGWTQIQRGSDALAQRIEQSLSDDTPCFGANALEPGTVCEQPFAQNENTNPSFAQRDIGLSVAVGRCELGSGSSVQPPCTFGSTGSPSKTIALIGDSHAGQLVEPLSKIAESNGWLLLTYIKSSCPGLTGGRAPSGDECLEWGAQVADVVSENTAIDAVIYSNATAKYRGPLASLLTPEGTQASLSDMVAAGKDVYVIRDPPASDRGPDGTGGTDFPTCISENPNMYDPCTIDRSAVITRDEMVVESELSDGVIPLIDLTDYFCDERLCHSVIGGLVVYADGGHLTKSYATSLSPHLERALAANGLVD